MTYKPEKYVQSKMKLRYELCKKYGLEPTDRRMRRLGRLQKQLDACQTEEAKRLLIGCSK